MSSTSHEAQLNPSTSQTVSSTTTISQTGSGSGSGSGSGMGTSAYNSTSESASTAALKAKMLASSAYDSIKKNVSVAADVTSKNIAKLQSRPTMMVCSNTACSKQLAIPPSVWAWKCTQGHENNHANQECDQCHESKLNALGNTISWPALLCQNCGTVTAVPHSELENSIYNSAYMIRHSFHELADPPKTFHCSNCNTLLLVPTGPWVCQTCTTQNYAGATQCSKCSQSKASQKVICGQCRKSTGIPTSGLLDNISSAFKSLASSTTKAYFDVTGQQNVACPTCKHPIKIPSSFTPIPVKPEAKHAEESKMPPTDPTSMISAQPNLSHQSWSLTLNCDNCHNSFQLLKQQQAQYPTASRASAAASSLSSANSAASSASVPMTDSLSNTNPSNVTGTSDPSDLNAIRHSVFTSDGQQVASMAPQSLAQEGSGNESHLYNASNAPVPPSANTSMNNNMPATSTTTTSNTKSSTAKNF